MRELHPHESVCANILSFSGLDYALLHITQTGLDKGYTDATKGFREFLLRAGVHDFENQQAGETHIKYLDTVGLTAEGPQNLKLSLQRPAAKEGRMFRLSMLGGLKQPLQIEAGDLLLFSCRENKLRLLNLTSIAESRPDQATAPSDQKETNKTIGAAKERILHVMQCMPSCRALSGAGASMRDIGDLSGMLLQNNRYALTNALLEELIIEGRIELLTTTRRLRLCH